MTDYLHTTKIHNNISVILGQKGLYLANEYVLIYPLPPELLMDMDFSLSRTICTFFDTTAPMCRLLLFTKCQILGLKMCR